MSGLLGSILGGGNRLRREVKGWLTNPRGALERVGQDLDTQRDKQDAYSFVSFGSKDPYLAKKFEHADPAWVQQQADEYYEELVANAVGGVGTVVPAAKLAGKAKQTWRGIDGIERANLDDRAAKLVNTLPKKGSIKLGELLEHDELYKLYPEMRNVRVERMPDGLLNAMGDGTNGAFTTIKGEPVIYLNPNVGPDQWVKTLIHEGGHVVQRREGMLGGANPKSSTELANKIREEHLFLQADNPKAAERVARMAKQQYGLDITAQPKLVKDPKTGKTRMEDPLAMKLYVKQQGEADTFGAAAVHDIQMRQKKHLSAREFEELPAPPFRYQHEQPINQESIFEDIFGYKFNEPNFVDVGTNGVRGMGESTADDMTRKLLGL